MRKGRIDMQAESSKYATFILSYLRQEIALKKNSCDLEDYLIPKSTLDIQKKLTRKMFNNLKDFMNWEKKAN